MQIDNVCINICNVTLLTVTFKYFPVTYAVKFKVRTKKAELAGKHTGTETNLQYVRIWTVQK